MKICQAKIRNVNINRVHMLTQLLHKVRANEPSAIETMAGQISSADCTYWIRIYQQLITRKENYTLYINPDSPLARACHKYKIRFIGQP